MNKKDYEEFLRHCEVLFKVGEEKTILRVVESQ
jgi:transposase-like protein